ncbi:MAG: hypothetical protein GF398_16300 [Chitinivibrionales bacterium]|nr:hypothetical protein [Chitinivibrionales bacterium]
MRSNTDSCTIILSEVGLLAVGVTLAITRSIESMLTDTYRKLQRKAHAGDGC